MPTANTTTIQPLLEYFESLIPLKNTERELVVERFHPHLFLKKQFALQHGQICDYLYFVVRGCLRMYTVDTAGVYHILEFATENTWTIDLASFHKKIPSRFNIDALEETVVLRIKYADLIHIYINAPKFDKIFRVLLENNYMILQDRIGQLFSLTAEERYHLFIENYPHLINRISQVQIAAFLGVTPQFLSMIRSRLANGSNH